MTMLKPQLYLHIGHPKTASSTIQSYLYQNWEAIERQGYMQPTGQLTLASPAKPPGNALWALQAMLESGTSDILLRWIHAAMTSSGFRGKLLLSSESLSNPEWPPFFQALTDIVDIRIIYYVRRQDHLLLSAWRQWGVKRGLSLNDFITKRCENTQPDYVNIISRWQSEMKITDTHIRFLDERFIGADGATADLASYLGLTTTTFTPVTDQNISVDGRLLSFFAAYPCFFSSVHDETIFDLLREPKRGQPDVRAALTRTQFKKIQDVFEPLNQTLLSRFQPSHHGLSVIDSQTAHYSNKRIQPTQEDIVAYVKQRLTKASQPNHPLLDKLRILLTET